MLLVSHPTGNANVRQALQAFDEAELLAEFATTVAVFPGNFWDLLSKTGAGAAFSRRSFDPRLRQRTRQYPARELARLIAPRIGLQRLTACENSSFSVDRLYQAIDRKVAIRLRTLFNQSDQATGATSALTAVYAYEDGALKTFRTAREQGLRCLYDLPIGYWRAARRIQGDECERLPAWAATMPALIDSDAKLARKDEELQLADQIIVASSFTAKTLEEAPFDVPQPIVIPYGCPEAGGERREAGGLRQKAGSGRPESPLRVLFVGGLSQRKGLSYLLDAVEQLGPSVELTLIGRKPRVDCRPLDAALAKYRWIDSLPHEEILAAMRQHDVFVFPSLFEGFGLVVTEALSQGLPVITTPHTCGPDILTEGEDGFIVPIRDSQAIAEKLELLHRDRERLAAMSEAAIATARRATWTAYRRELARNIKNSLSKTDVQVQF